MPKSAASHPSSPDSVKPALEANGHGLAPEMETLRKISPMMAQYSGDSRNLPSELHAPMTIVQTGPAANMTVAVTIGPTTKQINIPLTIQ